MSRDIRSFFNVVSKKNGTANSAPTKTPSNKRPIIVDSSDEDVIEDSPAAVKFENKIKRRKVEANGSKSKSPKSNSKNKKQDKLKPVNAADLFGSQPVKQSKVNKETVKNDSTKTIDGEKQKTPVKKKSKTKEEEDFQKTLDQLDDDFPMDEDILNQTIENAIKTQEEEKKSKTPKKTPAKRKVDEHNDSGMDPDQERYERKRHSAMLYQKYLNRTGPAHKGEKELPKGKPDCLQGLCFLKTGVLDSLEKDDVDALAKEHGGRTVTAVSKKVNYMIVGEDPGPAKLEKSRSYGIPEITEDEFLDLILTKSGLPAKYALKNDNDHGDEIPSKKPESPKKVKEESKKPKIENEVEVKKSPPKRAEKTPKKAKDKTETKQKSNDITPVKKKENKISIKKDYEPSVSKPQKSKEINEKNLSWTDKYKPKDIKGIIGQQGDKSNMNKLINWLKNWNKNHMGKDKPKLVKPSPWAKNDDGAYYKCALLSGPPGVGKTTTATLVSKELGYDVVEFNASDTRSKRLLHEEISQLLSSKSVASFCEDGTSPTNKHVLLMDEVDGMAGNEDRGGIQALIDLIKNTKVPIICMCNDRQHPKIRSLVNYCFDLRFTKPRPEQIKGAMMSICFKEGVKVSPDAMNEIIQAAGMDIRQTLNNLAMWTAGGKNLSSEVAHKESQNAIKDTVMGPWEVIRKVFSQEEHKTMSVQDKSRLFFYDYSIGPLFVQENYLQVAPHCDKKEVLKRVALAADAISMGDVIEKKIRSANNWSLMDSQALYSSVLPGHYMEGHFTGQINFPGWLGKNSKRTKFNRLLGELTSHLRKRISGNKLAINLDYIYHLRDSIVKPLATEGTDGVGKALEVMKSYDLLREDLDSILELSQWPKAKDPMSAVESKVKAAFTRAYNKDTTMLPYSTATAGVKKKTTSAAAEDDMYGDYNEDKGASDHEDDDDLSSNAMIKEKKKTSTKDKKDAEAGTSKKASSSRGKNKKLK